MESGLSGLVSVPYRGFIILNDWDNVDKTFARIVSVPYRGFIILNGIALNFVHAARFTCFRPLSGLYYSK